MGLNVASEAEKIRDGIFLAASRTYGEQYIEPLVRYLYGLLPAENNAYDALDPSSGARYEIKAAKVLRQRTSANGLSVRKRIDLEVENTPLLRMVPYAERYEARYGANIQNVKRDHFDFLLYILLFSDRLSIFKLASVEINRENVPHWSDKHGRYDAFGKSGQFNINRDSIAEHEKKYRVNDLSYADLVVEYDAL